MRLQENQVPNRFRVSRVDMGCFHWVNREVPEKFGTKKVNFDLLDSYTPFSFSSSPPGQQMFENMFPFLFTIFGLWIGSDKSAFLPPISGLSVLTGEKTRMPIWKI